MEADDADAAERLALALRAALAPRSARCRIETTPKTGGAGVTVSPGVWDAEGRPLWLTPLPVEVDAQAAARKVLTFLESWGFIARAATAPAS